ENDFRAALFEPFEGPSSGGRKPGMGRGRRLLAERILERSEGSAFGKVKAVREEIATWDEKTRRWIPKPDISDDDIAVLRAATKINYKNASDRVNKLLRDYEHKTST